MKKSRILGLMMAAVAALGFAACQDKNEIDGSAKLEMRNGDRIVAEGVMDHDPTAAYPMTFSVELKGNTLVAAGGQNRATDAAIAIGLPSSNTYGTSAQIADYGKVGSLKAMKFDKMPTTFAEQCTLEVGHGYVVKASGLGEVWRYQISALHDPDDLYCRIYVAKEVKGSEGTFLVYYQYPFLAEE